MDKLGTWGIIKTYRNALTIIEPDNFTITSNELNQISGYVRIRENINVEGFEINGVEYDGRASIDFIWYTYVTFTKDEDGRTIGKLTKNELKEIKLFKYYGKESLDEKEFIEMIQAEYEAGSLLVGDFTLVNINGSFY